MQSRLLAALFVAAAVGYACGPRPHSAELPRNHDGSGPPVASSLEVKVNSEIAFAFHVTNNATKRMEITFASGQTHDIMVLDTLGQEVWRWSRGRMFTQALQNRVLESNETMTYQARWKPATAPGKYIAVASLRSQNHPLEQRVEFEVP
jgi:hypothetical protein